MMQYTASAIAAFSSLVILTGVPIVQAAAPQPVLAQLEENAISLHDQGIDKMKDGDIEGAISDFTAAIKAQPKFSMAYYHRGRAHEQQQDLKAAIADYTQAIQINANWGGLELPAAYVSRGNARDDDNDSKGALTDYGQALKLDPNYGLAYENRGITYMRLNDKTKALQNLRRAVQLYKAQGKEADQERVMQTLKRMQAAS